MIVFPVSKGREIWGLYSRESRETGIPAHPCVAVIVLFNRYGVHFYILFVEVEEKLCNVAKGVILMYFNKSVYQ